MLSTGHRSNCFDIIRHFAALCVLFSHHYALSKIAGPKVIGSLSFGGFAVMIFFSISGFLITKSFHNSESSWSYLEKRLRRLIPGLVGCSIFLVVLSGMLGSSRFIDFVFSARGYNAFIETVTMGLLKDTNGLTQKFIVPAINGSLWTLAYELKCYLIIPAVLILFRRSTKSLIVLLVLCIWHQAIYQINGYNNNQLSVLTSLLIPFTIGALMHFYEGMWSGTKPKILIAAACLLVLLITPKTGMIQSAYYPALSILTIIIGTSFSDKLISGKFDYSYGIYIYAFPAQQICINLIDIGFWPSMLLSVFVTVVLAAVSWHLIEKPFLRRPKKLNANAKTAAIPEGSGV
ncbi:acyltransferase [Pseudomonas juntendi]|uniref:acyltransferase family protein n=1 Tax=Pseudomonas TaxID=286 RepID=UPI0034D6CB26